MPIREVRSPISTRRADAGGHVLRHVGKNSATNPKVMKTDTTPMPHVPPPQRPQGVTPAPLSDKRR
jgi:hypothetical protein